MKFIEFKGQLKKYPVFSTTDIRKIDSVFDYRRLVEWQKKGYIKKIINRWYVFSGIDIHEQILFLIANKIYTPSYISFESALSYYNIIPEGVYTIASASSLKTKEFDTNTGVFTYRHLKPSLLFGYQLHEANEYQVKIADLEKTLLDYFYINSYLDNMEAIRSLRINTDILQAKLDNDKLNQYLRLVSNNALEKRILLLLKHIQDA